MSAADADGSPFKGLSAFDDSDDDALLFFGREREREIVVANLIASRLTVLYGPSGVGKSSLLHAGVARSLRALPEEPLVVVFSRWSDDPAEALTEASAAQSERDVYLVLDQAEEYFLYHADDVGPGSLADELPALLAGPGRVNVLVSLREDALAKLDRFTGRIPGVFANTLRLDRLDRESARAAIVRPVERFAELTGTQVAVEPELVERVLDEVGAGRIDPALGGLGAVDGVDESSRIEAPYLQLVMQRLWGEERAVASDALRLQTLERLGGAHHIVEEHLEGAMAELTAAQKDVAARLFNHLVTPSGTKIAHELSDLADFGQVPRHDVSPVLEALAERRILRSLEEGEDRRYEIFHDVLAQPVLAWRARHRTEREVERELAERQRRRSRLQRLLALGAAVVALVAVIAGFAVVQRANANENSRDAQARRLDASAIALLPEDPELSLLLAAESARTSPSPTAEDALVQSLLTSHVRATYAAGSSVSSVSFSPDGRQLAFAGENGRAHVFDVRTGSEILVRKVGPGGDVSFGAPVLLRGAASPVRIVDPRTEKVRCVLARAADAAAAGRFVALVRNGIGYLWDARSCRRLRTVGRVGKTAVSLVASPDGTRAAFRSGREARVVAIPGGRTLFRLVHRGEITSLAFSGDARLIVTGGRDGVARIWNGRTGMRLHELAGHTGQVLDVAIAARGTEVATASSDGTARIWDATTGALEALLFGHTDFVRTVDFSPDGLTVATGSDDSTARTWALNGRRIATLAGHRGGVVDAVFSPDGRSVATGGEDGTVRMWDAGTAPQLVRAAMPPPALPKAAVTSSEGASATIDGKEIRLVREDGTTTTLSGHRLAVSSAGFSPDGERLVTAERDGDLILWDVDSGRALRTFRGHFGAVADARFSPDGRWIASAGPRSVGLWRASDGKLTRLLFGPEGPFTAVAFLDDSRTIVALTEAGEVSAYNCRICGEIPELLALADERLAATGRELTPEERELYFS